VAGERLLAHADVTYRAEGCASGRSHAEENPWASMPSAVLHLVDMFENATRALSSALGIRVVLDMTAPPVDVIDMETPAARCV
jgi:hypothetical protein